MLAALVAFCCLAPAPPDASGALQQGFARPPAWARPHTWWHWMAGNVTKEGITADLEAMKFAGIGGAHIFDAGQGIPAGPIAYNSPEWRDLMAFAMSEAQRLGLDMTMHNCSGWSSSGGPWVNAEDAMKRVVWSSTVWTGPGVPPAVGKPNAVGDYYRDIALLAFQTSSSGAPEAQRMLAGLTGIGGNPGEPKDLDWPVMSGDMADLTSRMKPDGSTDATLPAGKWTLLRLGYTLTGARNVASRPSGEGLEVDKLSATSLDRFMEGGLLPLFERIGEPVGKAFRTVLIDSYETGFQNWTPTLVADFKRLRGYDPTPYLPALAGFAVQDKDTTLKFLFDFRRTLADLWGENYSGHFAARLKEHGLQLAVEPYGNGSFDPFTYAKPAGLIMGEYWVGEGQINGSVKHAASVAHVYGHSVVGAESLTASPDQAGWRNQPRQWKPFADRSFTTGINRIIYHRMAHQPWAKGVLPGMTMGPWGSHVDRTNTFWSFMPEWDEYLARCQFMLQSGVFVADVCVFTGEGSPQQISGEGYDLPVVPKGYDFDFCGLDPFMNLSVGGGLLRWPNGATYRVLALPKGDRLTLPVVRKIQSLVEAGAVVVGPRPAGSPSLADGPDADKVIAGVAARLWGAGASGVKPTGKGRVFWGKTLAQVLAALKATPDFATAARGITSLHRRIAGSTSPMDSYFVASSVAFPRTVSCLFRTSGRVPELWHPESGRMEVAPIWKPTKAGTQVSIPFEADGSVFVVFRKPSRGLDPVASVKAPPRAAQVGHTLRIVKAEYGALGDPAKVKDVTDRVKASVDGATVQIAATNDAMGGDPAYMVVKALRVTYVYDGETKTVTLPENETLAVGDVPDSGTPPTWELESKGPDMLVRLWEPGRVELRSSSGITTRVVPPIAPESRPVSGPWTVSFPPGWDAPAEVQLDKLVSWTDHPDFGVKFFSGTATYSKAIEVPASWMAAGRKTILDLGDVREVCRVRLNGRLVASRWGPPFRFDVTGIARPGANDLVVEVTNLWTNRLIGDEQFPDDMGWEGDHLKGWPEWFVKGRPRPEPRRKTFTTWRHVSKDTPLLPSGLLGPVTLRSIVEVRLPATVK